MDPTASIFLGILAGLFLAALAINYIKGQVQRKDRLLSAFSGCNHIDFELLANSKILVAVLNATNKLFDSIPDEEEKNELYQALISYAESTTSDTTNYTLVELTKKLSNDSLLDEHTHLSIGLKSLCREALKAVNTMNTDDPKTNINFCLFKKMIAFGLNNIKLADVHVHA